MYQTLRQAWCRRGDRHRNMRSRSRCSMCPAIHINSRSWLRSSSTHEPSDPPLRVVFPGSPSRGPLQRFGRPAGATVRPAPGGFRAPRRSQQTVLCEKHKHWGRGDRRGGSLNLADRCSPRGTAPPGQVPRQASARAGGVSASGPAAPPRRVAGRVVSWCHRLVIRRKPCYDFYFL